MKFDKFSRDIQNNVRRCEVGGYESNGQGEDRMSLICG